MINTCILGDSQDVLKTIESNSVDMVITSPPYDNLRSYNGEIIWSFDVFKNVALELARVIKAGGVIVWIVADATTNGSESGSSFNQALFFKNECKLNIHDTMIWCKDGGGAIGSNLCYTQNFEYMFVLSKNRPQTVNILKDKPNKSAGKNKSGVGRRSKNGDHKIEKREICGEFSRRNNWWCIQPENKNIGHPAVFPKSLIEDHIKTWTNEQDIILDPFAGSGTSLIAARDLNRKFIGIEKVEKYHQLIVSRLSEKTI